MQIRVLPKNSMLSYSRIPAPKCYEMTGRGKQKKGVSAGSIKKQEVIISSYNFDVL
jgi:hypothetical protein